MSTNSDATRSGGAGVLRAALELAAEEFDLIVHRLRNSETERAEGTAVCAARDARAVLEATK